MRKLVFAAAVSALAAVPAVRAADAPAVVGQYVETRTAEVFTGGCLMNSEGETGGREALMAWRIDRGRLDGVPLDGLAVVAAVTADVNLGTRELGGVAPSTIRSVLYVDRRADERQRAALASLARTLSNGFVGTVVAVTPVDIEFSRGDHAIEVRAGDAALSVATHMEHDAECSALQWFHPLAKVEGATLGVTRQQAYNGTLLGRRWMQTDRRSAFIGAFTF
ncbi:MAG TPA: DUF1326 domain-containing protein [Vicinamibacterales bacterium]|nr:DUF1326 domain-containing protein [Vicinamibacterales bacterium]